MKDKKVKLVVLDFDQTIIEQKLYQVLTTTHNLSYGYGKPDHNSPAKFLCNKDDNSSLRNPLYDILLMNKLIDQLIEKSDITIKDHQNFKTRVQELQAQNISFAVATRSSRVDEADYILKKFIGEDHNFIIVAGGGKELFDKKPHINKVLEIINVNNPVNTIQLHETILIDDNFEVIKGTMAATNNSNDHCSAVQIKPGEVNSGLTLLLNYLDTGETYVEANPSQFYSELPNSSELSGQNSSLYI